jgi:acyl-[acyl-carrier-protein]-phospholipid O-acyltransferase/long-chain-fatty-acid--[acyl-carrier-protein] ligase
MDAAHESSSPTTHSAGASLASAGFWGLLATQFLTALNDNIFRWLVIGIGKDHVAAYAKTNSWAVGSPTTTSSWLALFLVLPTWLAAPAGYLGDRHPSARSSRLQGGRDSDHDPRRHGNPPAGSFRSLGRRPLVSTVALLASSGFASPSRKYLKY